VVRTALEITHAAPTTGADCSSAAADADERSRDDDDDAGCEETATVDSMSAATVTTPLPPPLKAHDAMTHERASDLAAAEMIGMAVVPEGGM
jgi:hypothetical protein